MADLKVQLNGVKFKSPVFTAAGPNVATPDKMMRAVKGGAGGIVTKTVSTRAAVDPRPTIRKCSAGGLLNCETWAESAAESFIDSYRAIKSAGVPLICSIGYTPDDMAALGEMLEKEVHPDIFEFSTHYTGKEIVSLLAVARSLRKSVSVPIWMKISPNTLFLEELVTAASDIVDGFVAINSLGPCLDFDIENPVRVLGSEWGQGWLSGSPILPMAVATVSRIARTLQKEGSNCPVIGVGGVDSGVSAIKHIMAGASAVQICSAALQHGDDIYGRVAGEISDWLDKHGKTLDEIKGVYNAGL